MAGDFSSCPICSRPADPSGDHALACGGNNDRVLRHNSLRDVIFSAVQSAALSPRREVPSLVPDSLSRPADVYLPHWSHGRPAAVDVTVISPLQCHTLSQSASLQGYALSVAEKRKRAVHFEDCRRVGVSFLPLAVETLGGWSQDALVFLRAIGRHLASLQGKYLTIFSRDYRLLCGASTPRCGWVVSQPFHPWWMAWCKRLFSFFFFPQPVLCLYSFLCS